MKPSLLLAAIPLLLATAVSAAITPPARLAIYYGYPSLVNSAAGNLTAATASFAAFDVVVLGDGLEHPAHPDHANTQQVVTNLIGAGIEVYGYVDMGVTTQNLSIATAEQYVDEWAAMGVTGIFWDDAGYDYGVTRARQKTLIDYTHAQGLKAFANAWVPADIFATDTGVPTPLQASDWYLAESHPVSDGQFADLAFWWNKAQQLDSYRTLTGVRIGAIATGDDGPLGWANAPSFRQSLWAAYLFGLDAFGFTNAQYSSSGAGANRLQPLPHVATNVGTGFTGAPTMASPTLFERTTDLGKISVFGDSNGGGGTFRGGACDTTLLGDAIWPNCSAVPPAQSSAFGPRQKASEGFRYDFHRGVDIPQPIGDPVYAMIDGIVRLAGTDPGYSDQVIQLRHRAASPYLFSDVLHMDSVVVDVGDLVTVGDLVGYSGESVSEFDHMHFEMRDGCANQNCNRNPWGYLPYSDTAPALPTLIGANLGVSQSSLLLEASTLPSQLDLEGLEVTWGDPFDVSFDAINATTDPDFPEGLDHPLVDLGNGASVCILPAKFNTSSTAASYRFALRGLPVAASGGLAGSDVHGSGTSQPLDPNLPAISVGNQNQSAVIAAGGSATFNHVVTNNGGGSVDLAITAQSAQSNPLVVSPMNLSLAAGESALIRVTVTHEVDSPEPVGDCVVTQISDGVAPHTLVVVDGVTTSATPPASPWPCGSTPEPVCKAGAGGSLQLRDASDPAKRKLAWKFQKPTGVTAAADFGNPVLGGNRYRLCIYDTVGGNETAVVNAVFEGGGICGTKPCWKDLRGKGFKYRDRSGNGGGIIGGVLKAGDIGRGKLGIKGKGASLDLPGAAGATYLTAGSTVRVQLTEDSTGNCWETVFSATENVKKNDATTFKAARR